MYQFQVYDIGPYKPPLPIQNGMPDKYANLKIGESECFYVVRNNKALPSDTFIFQVIDLEFCEIHIHHYFVFNHYDKILLRSEGEHNIIFFCLKGRIMHRLKGMEWQFLHELEFNMMSVDRLSNEIYCKKKEEHLLVHLLFPKKDFIDLLNSYPMFNDFNMNVKNGINDILFTKEGEMNVNLHTVYKVLLLLRALNSTIVFNKIIIKQYLTELLNNILLKENAHIPKYKYNYAFLEEIYKLELHMNEHLNEAYSLKNFLKENKLSLDKVRESFKLIFGTTPKHYLIGLRLKEAQSLLKKGIDKEMIAVHAGYSNFKHLREALINNGIQVQ